MVLQTDREGRGREPVSGDSAFVVHVIPLLHFTTLFTGCQSRKQSTSNRPARTGTGRVTYGVGGAGCSSGHALGLGIAARLAPSRGQPCTPGARPVPVTAARSLCDSFHARAANPRPAGTPCRSVDPQRNSRDGVRRVTVWASFPRGNGSGGRDVPLPWVMGRSLGCPPKRGGSEKLKPRRPPSTPPPASPSVHWKVLPGRCVYFSQHPTCMG